MSVKSCEIGKPSGRGSIVFEFLASTKKYTCNSNEQLALCGILSHDTGWNLFEFIYSSLQSVFILVFVLECICKKSENKLSLEGEFVKNYSLINLFFPSWVYFLVSHFLNVAFPFLYLSTLLRKLYSLYVIGKIIHKKTLNSLKIYNAIFVVNVWENIKKSSEAYIM